jgi:hypothetical protein
MICNGYLTHIFHRLNYTWFYYNEYRLVCFMVLNDTFKNISVILWRSVLLVEETGVPGENTDSDLVLQSLHMGPCILFPLDDM